MNLSRQTIVNISSPEVNVPAPSYFDLPEKVLQFGTGVLLRGLPDYFIDKANKQGIFNGRVVVVKSTRGGDSDAFAQQDGMFTLCVRGIENGETISENIVNASISRMLSARFDWAKVLECAQNPAMEIIVSNTTEVGIELVLEDIRATPPGSFPGKLLAFLLARYKAFNGSADKGMVIIPTELITDNGAKLKKICQQLAVFNDLPANFMTWLDQHNHFCNSLVDRIVPGKLPAAEQQEMEKTTGYKDSLMIKSEVYRLWAIESNSERVKKILSFREADAGVVIAPDINVFRELKLRLLNGSHTFTCGLSFLAGFSTVKEAMGNPAFNQFISALMLQEIAPAITGDNLSLEMAKDFALKVLDRYRNPHIDHQWISITMQYSSKMKLRNIPVLLKHYERNGTVPELMAAGFAAHLLFMRCTQDNDQLYYGNSFGRKYLVNDDHAAWYAEKWTRLEAADLVREVLSDAAFWDADLASLPGFAEAVTGYLQQLLEQGAAPLIEKFQSDSMIA
ncbi:MAG: tagaturonate reductase [Pseudobacter sp.]|uniref:tagaturonate reductase n=1 Tax=Pseudobacter sp. TaxID=2045420 RepID=UPI003F7D69D5